ncbi:MAG: TIGR02530 family flagellar biosynthesis protein [Armatimonadota bacterium]|nr:flagellar protein [bacterium]MDW8320251.1 TIGR02530 family flagellar biosynthesis protein [Armatimonadota bacterium]
MPEVRQIANVSPSGGAAHTQRAAQDDKAFHVALQQAQGSVRFSAHAQARLQSRQIQLDSEALRRVENAVDKAAEKGSRESLLLMDNVALIVSVRNRTVITAIDKENLKENVFTNIDSAVVL